MNIYQTAEQIKGITPFKVEVPAILRVQDVQELYKIGRATVYAAVDTGELPSFRIGKLIRIRAEDAAEWITRERYCVVEPRRRRMDKNSRL